MEMSKEDMTVTITTDRGSVTTTQEAIENLADMIENGAQSAVDHEHGLPINGKLLKALLTRICDKKPKDCPENEFNSIGIGKHSLAATDRRQGVVIGEVDDDYEATSMRSARLEAERATIYDDAVRPENIERIVTNDGEIKNYPRIGKIVSQIDGMRKVADLDPELLLAAAQIAVASGASTIALYQEEAHSIGFRFTYYPSEQLSLFHANGAVPVAGVIAAKRTIEDRDQQPANDCNEDS